MKKMNLINWDKVVYRIKPDELSYYRHLEEEKEKDLKRFQPKTWELFLTLFFFIMIYTTFVISLTLFLTLSNSIFIFIPLITIFLTMFMFNNDFIQWFSWWVRGPVLIYYLILLIYIFLLMLEH